MTPTVSILIPSRHRFAALKQTIQSFRENSSRPEELEFLVWLDFDDVESIVRINELEGWNCITLVGDRGLGALALEYYVNVLARQATGDWLFCLNDDFLFHGPQDWLAQLKSFRAKYLCLHVGKRAGDLIIAPLFTRAIYDLLGHVSLNTHYDTWIQDICRAVGIVRHFPLQLEHLRDSIGYRDELTRETNLAYASTNPKFYSPHMALLREQDIMQLQEALNE